LGSNRVNLVRSILFAIIYYLGCVPTVLMAAATIFLGRKPVIWGSRLWARWHRWCARYILGLRSEVDGTLPQEPALVIFKHESMFETIETLVLFDRPAVVMKKELVDMPFWGNAARQHGVIPVDRDAGAKAMRAMMTAAKQAVAEGRPIVLFPEGTRVPHGERPELKSGMAGLYKLLGLPVIPIALDSGLYAPKGSFIKKAGVVRMKVGEAIPPGLPREEIEALVHAAINVLNG
jgi:1-acyl-sn-glycerol-3-phosphate acyltransferase